MMTHLFYLFAYVGFLAMSLPLFFPFWHALYFVPFLVLCFYRCPFIHALWWSLLCGFIVDLFSAETRLGTFAMNYCLTTFFLYHYKFHFFEDRMSTLPTLTFAFSCLSMLIQVVIFYAIGKSISLSWEWVINDLMAIPLQGALYAILAFTLPAWIATYLKTRYFLFRKFRS